MKRGAEGSRSPLEGVNLELDFPCPWTYTVFGSDEHLLRTAVKEVVESAEHTLEPSQKSKGGKYRSMHLVVEVHDDEHRLSIFRQLHEHSDVVYVL